MLIYFSTKNFLVFKEKQCLDMRAGRYSELPGNVITVEAGGQELRLLRSAVLYGANAAGKSGLIYAMSVMSEIICHSAASDAQMPAFFPFLFDDTTDSQPSEFETMFIADGVRYQYSFSTWAQRIYSERLLAFPQGRQQRWFERHYDGDTNEEKWEWDKEKWGLGSNLLGEKELWKKSTRPGALFLSTAVNLNSQQLKPVADWFANIFRVTLGLSPDPRGGATVSFLEQGKIEKKSVQQYLNGADLDIADFTVEESSATSGGFSSMFHQNSNKKQYEITTTHKTPSGTRELRFGEESTGTYRMLSLAGPWILALQQGHVLSIDELNIHLHPHLSRYLVNMFHDPERNKSNAQLIFTTHDTSMLSNNIFRRDQIWFLEKDEAQATSLYSLSEKESRRNKNWEAAYLDKQYGALPRLKWYK